jgi:hypothetical protein
MTITSDAGRNCDCEKVVIHLESEVVKGFLEPDHVETLDAVLLRNANGIPQSMKVRRLGAEAFEDIPIAKLKAIFYVKDFDGNARHKDLQFYKRAPLVHGIWSRVEFLDGEVMEGLVHNTIGFVRDPGFFIRPTDPASNNRVVYVLKSWLKDFRILGLRNL